MSISKKTLLKSAAAALVLALLGLGVLRALSARTAQSEALAAASNATGPSVVELAPSDVLKLQTLDVAQGLPISGTLKAVNSAVIKARVAGELRGLTVREGDFVKVGQVIARIDASEYQSRVRQSKEQAESARAQVDVVQRQYDNNKALVDQGFISKTSLDTSLANLNAAQATYKAAVAATEVSAKSVEDTILKAPIAGQVSQRLVQPGERVSVDARIIEIIDVSRLELEASLSATDSIAVRVGQNAELQIEGNTQSISAQVVRINPSAQAGSRSVVVYLSLAPMPGLRQGLYAQGSLGTSSIRRLALPISSVRTDKPQPYVQLSRNQRIEYRNVQLGERGMAAGEEVVAVQGLDDKASVLRGNIGLISEGVMLRTTPQNRQNQSPQQSPQQSENSLPATAY